MKDFSIPSRVLKGLELLKDMFSSVTGRVNGFEHVLKRRSKEFRMPKANKMFAHKSGCGPQECARRLRQMERNGAKFAVRMIRKANGPQHSEGRSDG